MPDYTVFVRDATRNRIVEVDDYTSLELVLRFNDVSRWVLDLPASTAAADALVAGSGIVVQRDGTTILSGPLTNPERVWNADENRLVAAGPDDLVWLARRVVYPAPTATTHTSEYDVRSGVAETVMRQFVDFNAAASAHNQRRVPGLTLAADEGRGDTVTGRGRFQQLLELVRKIALVGGDLGFRIRQSGTDLQFSVYEPADKTATAIFSEELGNLAGFTYSYAAAEANYVIAGGGGEGVSRTFVEGSDTASIVRHGRIERFIDQRATTDTTELAQAVTEQLEEDAERTALSIDPVDTDAVTFGVDYDLGDQVTVMVDGTAIRDVVREVRIVLDGSGEQVVPVVGTPDAQHPDVPRLFGSVARLDRRLSNLERR